MLLVEQNPLSVISLATDGVRFPEQVIMVRNPSNWYSDRNPVDNIPKEAHKLNS